LTNFSSPAGARRGLRAPLAAAIAVAALLSLPVVATAGHWSQFGGDAGRSGDQPVEPGVMPVTAKWRKAETRVQTSIITSAGGPPTEQRVVYGTIRPVSGTDNNCEVHLQRLGDGTPVGPVNGLDICRDNGENAFGDRGNDGSVTPVESSNASGFGQVYAIHNDQNSAAQPASSSAPGNCTASKNDIAIAQIKESDGTLVKDFAIGGPGKDPILPCGNDSEVTHQISEGFMVNSSPVLSPPMNANGDRVLFFLASKGETERLFKVTITNAGSDAATFSYAYKDVEGANTMASPSFGYFRDADGNLGPYVILPQAGDFGGLTTYRVGDLGAGPKLEAQQDSSTAGTPWTPSSPVTGNGRIPGESGSGTLTTPFVYLPIEKTGKTRVFKLQQQGVSQSLSIIASSAELNGKPGKAIAVSQPYNGSTFGEGRIAVGTDRNLFVLGTDDLSTKDQLQDTPQEQELATDTREGFRRTAPAISGQFIYITRDRGTQLVLRLSDAERVCGPADIRSECAGRVDFAEDSENTGGGISGSRADFAIGQPAISNQYVQFASDKGVFVYRASVIEANVPTVEITEPADGAKVSGAAVKVAATATDDSGVDEVEFYLDGASIGKDTKPAADGPDHFSITFDSTSRADRAYQLSAVARGPDGESQPDTRTIVIDNTPNPTAQYTYSPESPQPSGTEFTFDGSGSTPTGSGQAITKYQWDFDGDGQFDTSGDAAAAKVVKHTFAAPGTYQVTLRVTQTNLESDDETKTIEIANRAPVASYAAAPNPAQTGQAVEFDGTASTDADGTIAKYEWDLDGDGRYDAGRTASKVTTSYAKAGKYTTRLRVTDNDGETSEVSKDVVVGSANQPPAASFILAPNPAKTGVPVGFDARESKDSDGSIVRHEWDLDGDGSFETNTAGNPLTARTYATAGVFNVRLRVTDDKGAATETVRQLVVVAALGDRSRVALKSFTVKVTPKRDAALPINLTMSGKLGLPAGVNRADACKGRVSVIVKVGKKTVSRRTVAVTDACTFKSKVQFRDRERLGKATRVRIQTRFQGNAVLLPKKGRLMTARIA
jgi:PKD repeat protein